MEKQRRLKYLKTKGTNYAQYFFFFLDFPAVLSVCASQALCTCSLFVCNSSWLCCSLDLLSCPSREVKAVSHSPSCKTRKWNTRLSRFQFYPDVTLSFDFWFSPHVSSRDFWNTLGLRLWGAYSRGGRGQTLWLQYACTYVQPQRQENART